MMLFLAWGVYPMLGPKQTILPEMQRKNQASLFCGGVFIDSVVEDFVDGTSWFLR